MNDCHSLVFTYYNIIWLTNSKSKFCRDWFMSTYIRNYLEVCFRLKWEVTTQRCIWRKGEVFMIYKFIIKIEN